MRLLLAALLALSGPASAAAESAHVLNRGCFVHLTTRAWFTFDPAAAFDAVSFMVTGNVYEPLIAFKSAEQTDEFLPFLAAEVPTRANGLLSEDLRTYRFPIRKGVKFHEGAELTPEDVRYSLLRFMLTDAQGGPSALLLKPILGVYSTRGADGKVSLDFKAAAEAVKVDGDAVVVRLAKPDPVFLKVLASLPLVVCRAWAAEHGEWDGTEATWTAFNDRSADKSYLDGHMNGTGPYRLSEADGASGKLVLVRHAGYWRAPAALEHVYLRTVPGKAVRLSMLENGDADAAYFEAQDYFDVSGLSDVQVVDSAPGSGLGEVLFFTFAAEPGSEGLGSGALDGKGAPADLFSDLAVRQGVAYALDYERYLRRGLAGRGRRTGSPIPEGLLPSQGRPPYRFDLDKAREAFKKARGGAVWENGFTVTLTLSPSNASRMALAELVRDGLARVNPKFQVLIKTMSSKELYAAAEAHRLPLFIAGYYSDYPDARSFANGMLHGAGYYPRAQRFSDSKLDGLVEEASSVADPEKRRAAWRAVVRRGAELVPHLTTYEPSRFTAARRWVKGFDSDVNVSNMGVDDYPYFYAYSKE
ncbi:ABC transporter substrate-binding protein [bacterium]|nr:MAG: ABC transporter substrate-binding protein [bacterium]